MGESIFPACLLPAINLSLQNPPVSEAGVGEGTSAMSPFTFVFCLVFCPEKGRNSNPCRNSRKEQCKHNAFGRKADVTAAAAKTLQWCPTLCDRWQPTRLPCPSDSQDKNTGVGCHFLLQCVKVESETEVAQSCQIRSDPMDCSLPGSSIHGISQARVLEWGAIAFSS